MAFVHRFGQATFRQLGVRTLFLAALAGLTGAAVLASGWVGPVVLGRGEPKDAELVWSLLWHSGVGIAVTLVQCGLSIAIGHLLFRRVDLPVSHAFLFGFPASFALVALGSLATLTLPGGGSITALIFAGLLLSLWRDATRVNRWRSVLGAFAAMCLPAAAFGVWLGLLWHGPTATLSGWPAGDEVYYTTLVTTLAFDPWPLRNWGVEGESASAFNLLWPAIGAALSKASNIEPFAFVVAAGGTAFMLCTAIALWAYLASRDFRPSSLGSTVLVLAFVAAGRYPFWIVESPPMIHTAALTVAIWFWVTQARGAPLRAVGATAAALMGALLTKVVSATTLVPLAMGSIAVEARTASRVLRVLLYLSIAIVGATAAWLFIKFAPRLVAVGGLGPEGYVWMFKWGSGFKSSSAYLFRDVGTFILAIAAFTLAPRLTAAAVAIGLVSSLVAPFAMRGAFVSSVLLIGLVAFENPDRLARTRTIVLAGLILCLPAMLFTDPGGPLTGAVWVVCMIAAVRATLSGGADAPSSITAVPWAPVDRLARYTASVSIVAVAVFLLAVAQGRVAIASSWVGGKHKLTPEIRELWHTLPQVAPVDALVFTDQTGPDWGLLGGWNTYAFHGKRQLFISTWVQSSELQVDLEKRAAKLRWNDRVLDGSISPAAVPVRGQYDSFYAVVKRGRVPALAGWVVVREVRQFDILRWEGRPAVAPGSRS